MINLDEQEIVLETPQKIERMRFREKFSAKVKSISPTMYVAMSGCLATVITASTLGIIDYQVNQANIHQLTEIASNVAVLNVRLDNLNTRLESSNKEIKDTMSANSKVLDDKITSVDSNLSNLKLTVDGLSNLQGKIDNLSNQSRLVEVQHQIEKGVVTDYFYVSKITFTVADGKLTNVFIDVDNQPSMSYTYSGYGNYSIVDRDLRSRAKELVEDAKDRYNEKSEGKLPLWDKEVNVRLTVKNYLIGNYSGATFKLKGE